MEINYAVSLWNFYHYADPLSLAETIALVRRGGYGIELWPKWPGESDLYDASASDRLGPLVEGMNVSLHGDKVKTFREHANQIDVAAAVNAAVVVVHPGHFVPPGSTSHDVGLIRDIVAYGAEHGVKIALENGAFETLVEATDQVDGLGVCLDVGHVYFSSRSLADYLRALKHRLIHLHIQDIATDAETGVTGAGKDHYMLGTGGIPRSDWQLLVETLKQIDYRGTAVVEVQPRTVLQTAVLAENFMKDLLADL